MATSSITKNFVVSGEREAERFADAIEESYQESFKRNRTPSAHITQLHGAEAILDFMKKREAHDAG